MLWLLFTIVQLSVYRQYYITVSRRSIVTMAQSRVVSEIVNVEKIRDLEIGVRGHSKSSKVLSFERPCMVSYYCSLVTLSLQRTVFEIFDL